MAAAKSQRRIAWGAPAIIIAAFSCGLAFAIAHHAFYMHLDTKPVDSNDHLFSQQVNVAVGTAFAFLFRASLLVAIGAAYWQIFWGSLVRKGKVLTLAQVDSLGALLGSLVEFCNIRAIAAHPVLGACALLSWMVPLAALLPPATLGVVNVSHIEETPIHVPVLNLTTDAVMRPETHGINIGSNVFSAASPLLNRMTTETAFRGEILEPPASALNMSYRIAFFAPAVSCREARPEELSRFRRYMSNCDDGKTTSDTNTTYCGLNAWGVTYIAWAPNRVNEGREWMTTLRAGDDGDLEMYETGDAYRAGQPNLLVAARSVEREVWLDRGDAWVLLKFSLHNATYETNVSSTSAGRTTYSDLKLDLGEAMTIKPPKSDVPVSTVLGGPAFAYAVMDSLITLLSGYMWDDSSSISGLRVKDTSDVTRTTLIFARELLYSGRIRDPDESWSTADILRKSRTIWPGEAFQYSTFNRSLATGIEELFNNITLSLFSKAGFLGYTGRPTTVREERWLNVYTNRQRNLLISYGIALALTLLVSVYGLTTIHRNGVSYSYRFSTILRATRDVLEDFDAVHNEEDRGGADPLPKHLSKARIDLGRSKLDEHSNEGQGSCIETSRRSEAGSERSAMMGQRVEGQASSQRIEDDERQESHAGGRRESEEGERRNA